MLADDFAVIQKDEDWDIVDLLDAQQGWEKRVHQFFQMRDRQK